MANSRKHILLVEENRDVRLAFTCLFEEAHGFELHPCSATKEAIALTGRQNVDIAIVDVAHGQETSARLELIKSWRSRGYGFPVIATSAHDYDGLSVECLNAGSDDFLRKPFMFSELDARVRRQLTRATSAPAKETRVDGVVLSKERFFFADATIRPDLTIQFPSGWVSELSAKQFGILKEFASNAGKLVLKEHLVYAVWGADANSNSMSVNQYISVLRNIYREGGIDLNKYIIPASKAGWRIAAEAGQQS
jgi:DNA-binding response OmpR family regulator